MLKIMSSLSIANSIFIVVSLKLFHVFHFIEWHPLSFMKSLYPLQLFGVPEKWLTLAVLAAVLSALVFFTTTWLTFIPNGWLSLLYGGVFLFVFYSILFDFRYEWHLWKSMSIPFVALIFVSVRFIVETSSFYTKEKLFR